MVSSSSLHLLAGWFDLRDIISGESQHRCITESVCRRPGAPGPTTNKVLVDGGARGFGADQETACVTQKPNKEILEHDCKRQIQLKLLVLEEKLSEQGYTDSEIAEKLEETRRTLEAAAASEAAGGPTAPAGSSSERVSETQTHQIAALKEKQMEKLKAALRIGAENENQKKQPDPTLALDSVLSDDEDDRAKKKHHCLQFNC
nr:protein starmaker-like isoform X1 [Ipomoea batatas]